MVNRNETWANGSEPGDLPIFSVDVPFSLEEVLIRGRQERLRAFPTQPQTPGTVANAVSDLIRHLGLDV